MVVKKMVAVVVVVELVIEISSCTASEILTKYLEDFHFSTTMKEQRPDLLSQLKQLTLSVKYVKQWFSDIYSKSTG